jgi:predicted transcriptional regulator
MSESEAAALSRTLSLTAEIVAAHVGSNATKRSELPDIIKAVHEALAQAAKPDQPRIAKEPAVPVKKSVFNDHIVCLECGRPFRTMKRHLHVDHNLTADEYRARYQLPREYPLIAPEYAEARSKIALTLGLGRRAAKAMKKGAKRS